MKLKDGTSLGSLTTIGRQTLWVRQGANKGSALSGVTLEPNDGQGFSWSGPGLRSENRKRRSRAAIAVFASL